VLSFPGIFTDEFYIKFVHEHESLNAMIWWCLFQNPVLTSCLASSAWSWTTFVSNKTRSVFAEKRCSTCSDHL